MDKLINIQINPDTCIRCGHCAAVCPAYILGQSAPKADIDIRHTERCIQCGQCVDVCPTDALAHSVFGEDSIHLIKKDLLPSPEQMIEIIRARRSNRTFGKDPVAREQMDLIVEAGQLAPTGTNSQQKGFVVVNDRRRLDQIAALTIDSFAESVRQLENPINKLFMKRLAPDAYKYLPALKKMVAEPEKAMQRILHDAPTLLFIYAPKKGNLASENCNLAYQNASLMAESLGISQFYLGFVMSAYQHTKRGKRLNEILEIDQHVFAGMALGKPRIKFKKYTDRKVPVVKYL